MNKLRLEEIYHDIIKIEQRPPIAGHEAERLINISKQALKGIKQELNTAHIAIDLKRFIEEMEDEYATDGKINTLTCNLGVRGSIHVAVTMYDRLRKK